LVFLHEEGFGTIGDGFVDYDELVHLSGFLVISISTLYPGGVNERLVLSFARTTSVGSHLDFGGRERIVEGEEEADDPREDNKKVDSSV
jgi:hypothetical protein